MILPLQQLPPCASAGFAMRKRKRGPPPWNPPALAPARSRECTQRWCDEKGNAVCEICLQEFEPGYTIAEKKALVDVGVTIRGSLEVPRLNYDPHNPEFVPYNDTDSDECSPASRRRASYFRSVTLIFMVIFLVRNLVTIMTVGADHYYAFTFLTVFLLRASVILLPLYLVIRFISAFQEAQQQEQLQHFHVEETFSAHRETLERYEQRIQIRL
ncbi:uncharacterized protein LOC122027519 isoform X2 [Zingiber officinale]|uniref:uncharacterized protein LOC122027519 isoform X2 n=1 Tax=Zingiber officinale TaxID=94328 RepID=UPI001C4B9226|nr:uncharacterized protein LOC122027519 isoform X2 [Zingiber officinale]